MKVYIVFWFGAFEDWSLEKVFSSEEDARNYIKQQKVPSSYEVFRETVITEVSK